MERGPPAIGRHDPHRLDGPFLRLVDIGQLDAAPAGLGALPQRLGEAGGATASTDASGGLLDVVGKEDRPRLVETQLAAPLREQAHIGVPTTRHQHRVASDGRTQPLGEAAFSIDAGERCLMHAVAPIGTDHDRTGEDPEAARPRLGDQGPLRIVTNIDHGGDLGTGLLHGERCSVGRIVIGEDERLSADQHGIALEIGSRGPCQHDARTIIAAENQWTFDRTGGEHHMPGANAPQALTRRITRGEGGMVGDPLECRQIIVVVIGHGGRPGEDGHPVETGEFLEDITQPGVQRRARIIEDRAAGLGALIDQQHTLSLASCGQGCRQARGTGPHHQEVAMGVFVQIAIGVGFVGRMAEPGGFANDGLVDALPPGLGPHEGLVIERRRKEGREHVVDHAHIALQRRPSVLARGHQAVEQLERGGPGIGIGPAIAHLDLDQRIGLFRTSGDGASRPVIFEAPAHEMNTVGQECGGQRVARIAVIELAVEVEAQPTRAVEPATLGQPEFMGHRSVSGASGRASPMR